MMSEIFRRVRRYGALPALLLVFACGNSNGGSNAASRVDDGSIDESDDGVQDGTAGELPNPGVSGPPGAKAEGQGEIDVPLTEGEATPDASSDPLVVRTSDGVLRGTSVSGVDRFLGIPYAAPPLNELRFAPPAGPAPWTDERDASSFGAFCPQRVLGTVSGDENCLFLNVYRPAGTDASRPRPVLFWIHGGSFTSGAGSVYDPARLVATNDIVVVTINYRLGPLGFLALPSLGAETSDGLSGDYGLLDQQAALRWVQTNIVMFGGDPQQVTIAGESAGGASVCALYTSPTTEGLFARAIIQSASCASAQLADAETLGSASASAVGCADESNAAACLRGLTATEILQAPARAYGPVVGGQFLPAAPNDVVRAGQQHRGPVLVGGLRDEMLGFAAVPPYYPLAAEDYPAILAAWFPDAVDQVIERYPLSAYPEPFYALSTVFSDSGAFSGQALGGCVTDALAAALSSSTSTYAYELDDPNYRWPPGSVIARGASHASDLPFLFDIIGFSINQPFDATQNALADTMVRAWGAFVRSGNPGTPERDWPAYDAVEQSMLHLVPGAVDVTGDFRARHYCDFWRERLTPTAPAAGF